jgi:UDP-N-acetyl-D-glucosamine dehydrogenase
LSKTKEPDISFIVAAAKGIFPFLRKGQLVVLESTTFPGTTEEIFLPGIEAKGLRVGQDIYLAYSPERINPGSLQFPLRQIPKVIGAISEMCLEMACTLYATAMEKVVPVSSTRAAEMVKMLENTFRVVNIALVNEVALMCDRLGLDVWEIIEAAGTKPFGFMPFTPGPGLGGHCVPIDPQYLAWKLKTLNYTARFIGLASEVNAYMPSYVATKVVDALNEEQKAVKGSTILILGVTYKRDVADCRESPALDIIRLLKAKGALVDYHDPHVPCLDLDGELLDSVELTASCLHEADCTVIATDHGAYDWDWITQNARLIVDTRNATRHVQVSGSRIVKL